MVHVERLTPRESATLDAVARRLTNGEIAAEFHVSVRTVESHIASLRRKLAADSRAALIDAAQARRSATVRIPSTSFVGRADDLAAVGASLERNRWVTIVGPAGSGKTRLALEIAAAGDRPPVVVELEHIPAGRVVQNIAKVVGLSSDSSADLMGQCAVAMNARPHLLVLDNCDRVLDAVDAAVADLLAASRSVAVLATSRSPVGGAEESLHVLHPLPVDDDGAAVAMFVDRARLAIGSFIPSDDEQQAVARVCRRLDGLPLAIELAAARLRHLPLHELERMLDHGFGGLDRARPATRHRTLETAFDWTWDLLEDAERSVLSRLAALPRTFDLELAEVVAAPGAGRVVLRLLDRSLVAPLDEMTATRRFRLLDALREFVLDRTDPEVIQAVRAAHSRHFEALARRLAAVARTDDSPDTAARAAQACVDLNAAAHWALVHDPPSALSIATSLSVGAEQFNPDVDSLSTIALMVRDPEVRRLATNRDLLALGMAMSYWDLDIVDDLAQLAMTRATDPPSVLTARHLAGYADAYQHRTQAALAHLRIAEQLAIELDDQWALGSVRQARGIALRDKDASAAIAAFRAAMDAYACAGDAMHVNNARYMMAATAAGAGTRTSEARRWAEQCATYARGCGNHHELAHALLTRTTLSGHHRPDPVLDEVIDEFRTVGDLRCLTRALLLKAGRAPAADRVPLLRQAYEVSARARDADHQAVAVERLVHALWESGARRLAVVELGILCHLLGEAQARERCPAPMLLELDAWETTLAEGRARAAATP